MASKLKSHRFGFTAVLLFAMLISVAGMGCQPNPRIMNSAAEQTESQPLATPVPPSFEGDLDAMRTAEFTYIYVFRRKDGGIMDGDDRVFVNGNTPLETNRRKVSDEGRAIIIGTNFNVPPELMKNLSDRFEITDYSKPKDPNEKEPSADVPVR